MKYPKQVMKINELVEMGYSRDYLLGIYRNRHQNIAWKSGKGGKTSTIFFDTEELEKYRRASCTGV